MKIFLLCTNPCTDAHPPTPTPHSQLLGDTQGPGTASRGLNQAAPLRTEPVAKRFEGINWIFSKLMLFCLQKYCDSKSENEQFNIKKKEKKRKGGGGSVARNNTSLSTTASSRGSPGGAEGLLAREWKPRDLEELCNGAGVLVMVHFTRRFYLRDPNPLLLTVDGHGCPCTVGLPCPSLPCPSLPIFPCGRRKFRQNRV